jgi:hypothetical protein
MLNTVEGELIAEELGGKELSIIEHAVGNSLEYASIVPTMASASLNGRISTRRTAHLTIQDGHPFKPTEDTKHLQVSMRSLRKFLANLQLMMLINILLKPRSLVKCLMTKIAQIASTTLNKRGGFASKDH